jgi:hypothetical protein
MDAAALVRIEGIARTAERRRALCRAGTRLLMGMGLLAMVFCVLRGLTAGIAVALVVTFLLAALWQQRVWRCPACERPLGRGDAERCDRCGTSLVMPPAEHQPHDLDDE